MQELTVEEVGAFDLLDDDEELACGVGPRGEALMLVGGKAEGCSVLSCSGAESERIDLAGEPPRWPRVQPLPDGAVLVVETRCERYPDGSHGRSGRVFGPDGGLAREFLLGDGIEDVQTTADGRVWVSYFDEGIFGAAGWGEVGGPKPIGSSGLVRWSGDGRMEWTYEPPPGVDRIADCLAINVAEGASWVVYYDGGYRLVRIAGDDEVRVWATPFNHVVRAIAVGGNRALFYGGPPDERGRCVLVEFAEETLVELRRLSLVTSSGTPIPSKHVVGRGAHLHLFDGPHWYRVDVRELSGTHSAA